MISSSFHTNFESSYYLHFLPVTAFQTFFLPRRLLNYDIIKSDHFELTTDIFVIFMQFYITHYWINDVSVKVFNRSCRRCKESLSGKMIFSKKNYPTLTPVSLVFDFFLTHYRGKSIPPHYPRLCYWWDLFTDTKSHRQLAGLGPYYCPTFLPCTRKNC